MLCLSFGPDGPDARMEWFAEVCNHRGDEVLQRFGPYYSQEDAEAKLTELGQKQEGET